MSVTRIIEVVEDGRTQLVKFDLESTYNMDEFRSFVTMKESNLDISDSKLQLKFGKELFPHLNLAYELLKEVASGDI